MLLATGYIITIWILKRFKGNSIVNIVGDYC